MPFSCTTISDWIEERWSGPVVEWEEAKRQECKKRHWYDPVANELCNPVAVAVFGFADRSKRGQTSNPYGTTECAAFNLIAHRTAGVSFIDDLPDQVRKYVLVHELGHYFGLCHVDGFSRIMVSGDKGQGSLITPGSFPGTLVHGGPRFTLEEGKQAWRFILKHFPTDCLMRA